MDEQEMEWTWAARRLIDEVFHNLYGGKQPVSGICHRVLQQRVAAALRDAHAAGRAEGLEAAAGAVDGMATEPDGLVWRAADRIRALKEEGGG